MAGMLESAHDPNPLLIVVAAVVVRDGRVLLTRRRADTHLGGMWEFPGGKVETGEDPAEALVREMKEELGVEAEIRASFVFNYHVYPAKRVLLLTYEMAIRGTPRALGCAELGWFSPAEFRLLETPPADVPVFDRLRSLLGG